MKYIKSITLATIFFATAASANISKLDNNNFTNELAISVTPICQDITVGLDENGFVSINPMDVDNGSISTGTIVSYELSVSEFDCGSQGTNIVSLFVTDDQGNTGVCDAQVTIIDDSAPVPNALALPNRWAECEVSDIVPPMATDNCAGTLQATTSDPLVYNTLGTHVITWTFVDDSGNISTQDQVVIVDDITGPVVDQSSLEDLTGECEVSAVTAPVAMDNCYGTVSGTTNDPITFNTPGSRTIAWDFVDGNGNYTSAIQNVIVEDMTTPVALCKDISVALNSEGTMSITSSLINNESYDNCGISSFDISQSEFTSENMGNNTVILTVYDGDSNSASCTAIVEITPYNFHPHDLLNALTHGPVGDPIEVEDSGSVEGNVSRTAENSEISMELFPNPTNRGSSTLALKNMRAGSKDITVIIYDQYGTSVRYERIIESAEEMKIKFDYLQAFLPGVYTVYVNIDGKILTRQLVIS